jgi:hypothetical protein
MIGASEGTLPGGISFLPRRIKNLTLYFEK